MPRTETHDPIALTTGWEELEGYIHEHKGKLLRMLGGRLSSALAKRMDADDLLSETIKEAKRRWEKFLEQGATPEEMFRKSGMTPYAWLYRVACDTYIEVYRRETRGCRDVRMEQIWPEQSSVVLGDRLMDPTLTPGGAAARSELQGLVRAALEELDPNDREVLWMRHHGDLSFPEIASILGIAERTARRRYVHALERVRKVWVREHPSDKSRLPR